MSQLLIVFVSMLALFGGAVQQVGHSDAAKRLYRSILLIILAACFTVLVEIRDHIDQPHQVIVVTPEATSAR